MKCKKFCSLINFYLQDRIFEPELSEFEIHYFNCEQCFKELNLVKNLRQPELFNNIQQKETFSYKQFKLSLPITIAASLLIVVFSFFLLTNFFTRKSTIEIEAPLFVFAENRNNAIDEQIKLGFQLYNQKKYSQAAEIFASHPEYCQQVIFYRGICYLMIKEYNLALNDFDEIISRTNPSYYDDAIFFKAITLIKMKKIDEARLTLKELTQLYSPLQKKAEELLEKIN